jgi:hypothetical protein
MKVIVEVSQRCRNDEPLCSIRGGECKRFGGGRFVVLKPNGQTSVCVLRKAHLKMELTTPHNNRNNITVVSALSNILSQRKTSLVSRSLFPYFFICESLLSVYRYSLSQLVSRHRFHPHSSRVACNDLNKTLLMPPY